MEKLDKDIAENFASHFSEDIKNKFGENASVENIIYHIIDKGVATKVKVRNYVMVNDYYKYMSEHNGTMTDFCISIEDKYNMSCEVIKTMIYRYIGSIESKKHIK